MKQITLKGTYYEMGAQHGKSLRKEGAKFQELNEVSKKFAFEVEQQVRNIIPELIEEIHGIADGGNFDYELVRTLVLTIGITPSCTVFAIAGSHTADGKTIFARNYDAPPHFQHFDLYKTYPKEGLSHIGCVYDMMVGREDGVNEAGLAIACTGVHGQYTKKPGVWDHIPVRAVLDNCESLDEVVGLLQKIPHLYAKNFLVADSEGKIAVVEASQQNVSVTYPKNGLGVITNHFVSKPMQEYANQKKIMHKSYERFHNVKTWFESKKRPISIKDIKRVLNDKNKGVCSNKQDKDPKKSFMTVWSWVADLGERYIELTTGTPISGKYTKYSF